VASHLPQKDGILAGLLAAEMVAVRRRPLREQVRTLLDRIGPLHGRRIDYHTDAAARDRFLRRLETPPSIFAGRRIARIDETDGRRMTFGDGSWILIRPSSTMSLVRCYIEGRSPRDLDDLTAAARDLITKE
jgi:phosphomannomutase